MMWTILDKEENVIYNCLFSDAHPSNPESGWTWEDGHKAVKIDREPNLAEEYWDGKKWSYNIKAAQSRKIAQLKETRREIQRGGVDTSFGPVQTRDEDMANIYALGMKALICNNRLEQMEVDFRLANNEVYHFDNTQDILDLVEQVSDHYLNVHKSTESIKQKIGSAKSKKQLEAIKWPQG